VHFRLIVSIDCFDYYQLFRLTVSIIVDRFD